MEELINQSSNPQLMEAILTLTNTSQFKLTITSGEYYEDVYEFPSKRRVKMFLKSNNFKYIGNGSYKKKANGLTYIAKISSL